MTEEQFVAQGNASWSRLRELVGSARHQGIAKLDPDDLIALHDGYRRAASDLAYAQTHFPDSDTTAELNALVAAAHGFLYAAPARRFSRLVRFYTHEVPCLVRAQIGPIALAAALLAGATALAFGASMGDAHLGRTLLPANLRDFIGERIESARDGAMPGTLGPLISTEIMMNNIRVGFMSFAGGALAGTLTVYVLISNGLLLGALAGLFARAGLAVPFLALVVPHGALELPAIAIAAGAGFVLAEAIVNPGELRRRDAIRPAANTAVKLVLGTIPIFVVAGIIEGSITPTEAPDPLKLLVGVAAFAVLALWLGLGGRRAPKPPA